MKHIYFIGIHQMIKVICSDYYKYFYLLCVRRKIDESFASNNNNFQLTVFLNRC